MKLILERSDMKQDSKSKLLANIVFDDFLPDVQKVMRKVNVCLYANLKPIVVKGRRNGTKRTGNRN